MLQITAIYLALIGADYHAVLIACHAFVTGDACDADQNSDHRLEHERSAFLNF